MDRLQWRGVAAAVPQGLGTGITDIELVVQGGQSFVVATTGQTGGLTALSLAEGRLPVLTDGLYFTATMAPAVSGRLEPVTTGGGPALALGAAPGGAVVGITLDAAGRFGGVESLSLPVIASLQGAVSVVQTGSGFVFMAGADGAGGYLRCFRADGSGGFDAGQVTRDGAASYLTDPVALESVTVGGQEYLLSLCGGESGVSAWAVDPGTGHVTLSSSVGAGDGLGILASPVALAVAAVAGQSFVIVASANVSGGGAALSVMQLDATGALNPTDHVLDSRDTRFGQVQSLSVVEADGWVYVLAGGGDDGISLFVLMPNGQLVHLDTLVHDTGLGLSDISAIEAVHLGDELQVLVASEDGDRLVQLSFSLADQGNVITNSESGGLRSGGTADDLLAGGAGNDDLRGGGGDDILWDGAGRDTLAGQAGADIYVIAADGVTDRINGFEPGQDRLDLSRLPMLYDPGRLTIETTSWGARVIWQGEVLEIARAGGGGLSRAEILAAVITGPDPPLLQLNQPQPDPPPEPDPQPDPPPENLVLQGSAGPDTLTGGDGNDQLHGHAGPDRLEGGAGADLFHSGDGNDTVTGGTGRDRGYLGAGDDVFHDNGETGAAGSDVIYVGPGDDTVYGAGGNDIFHGLDGQDDLHGGTGNDTIYAGTGHDLVQGGDGHDELWGGIGHDTLHGGNGNDLIFALGGWDLLTGGAGNDTLWAGPGNDTVTGGPGQDRGYLGPGNDVFHDGDTEGGLAGRDVVYMGAGDDTAHGGAGDDVFHGLGGGDLLRGGTGNDTLYGGTDADTLEGGAGDDEVWGGKGTDLADLGDGDDLYRDTVQDGDLGSDTVNGGAGRDTILGLGGDDVFSGGPGGDSIEGGRGHDDLYGQQGADILRGGEGHDLLDGGWGDDTLAGGRGLDTLTGGPGADTFVFHAAQGEDRITDFTPGEDQLELHLPQGGLSAIGIETRSAGLYISWEGGGVLLEGVSQQDFDTGDIVFL